MKETTGDKTTGDMTGADAGTREHVSLVIPCKAEYLALCRLVAGALGARENVDEEFIADLKVVVTEVCNCFLAESGACAPPGSERDPAEAPRALRLDFFPRGDVWEITASNPDRRLRILPAGACDPTSERGLGLTIIQALTDSVDLTDDDIDGSVLRLMKRVSPEPSPPD
ncbi:MAG: ATP-binding protein [bacterium]